MATLKDLIERKLDQIDFDETLLRTGKMYTYSTTASRNCFPDNLFCWVAPATGVAIVDVWGAGGSSALMRCCGAGLPGNPGAWSRKCICVEANNTVCGSIGKACTNATTACFRGCSEPTTVCWTGKNYATGASVNGCICTQGGRGGTSWCAPGSAGIFCCFYAGGYCGTTGGNFGAGCGVICNFGTATGNAGCAESYGGDINKRGGFSCMTFFTCYSNCPCSTIGHVAVPPGLYACDGMVVTHGYENDNGFAQWSGSGWHQFISSMNAANPQPSRGTPYSTCWNGVKMCSCYEQMGCITVQPPGTGGPGIIPCADFCHHGHRGGAGLVKINFIQRV